MAGPDVPTRRWTRIEYDRLIDAGFFRPGDPVELLGGQMVVAEPQGSRHYAALRATQEALRAAFSDGWEIRGQGQIALDDESEPEPSSPSLVVEVSETSLTLDRAHKGSLYARAGLVDYWIVNLPERRLEVHRDAEPDATARFGWRYRSITILEPGASVSPLARPDRRIQVSDLFA
jgi:hypothetical protein